MSNKSPQKREKVVGPQATDLARQAIEISSTVRSEKSILGLSLLKLNVTAITLVTLQQRNIIPFFLPNFPLQHRIHFHGLLRGQGNQVPTSGLGIREHAGFIQLARICCTWAGIGSRIGVTRFTCVRFLHR